jgi:Viral BACON domain
VVQRLAAEMSGPQVVFLAYTWDYAGARQLRVLAAHPGEATFPIILVSSGHAVFTGPTSPYTQYRSMIQADLTRPASGDVAAWWQRDGNDVVVWATLRNTGAATLSQTSNGAALTATVYEPIYEFPFQDPVRGTVTATLTSPVEPGATSQLQARVVAPAVVDWSRAAVVALVDYRPKGTTGAYDVVQAARAVPAGLVVTPTEVAVTVVPGARAPVERSLALSGPSVLTWTATADAPWLEIEPATGSLPAAPVVRVLADRLPAASATATVTLAASGAGMSFTQTVQVRVATARLVRRHLSRR